MGPSLPNTNATVGSCVCVLSLLLVPLFDVVINCGDAKCIIVAGVILVANVGQRSRVDKTTASYEITLVFDVRMGHAEATTFNARLLITIIMNNIVVIDCDRSKQLWDLVHASLASSLIKFPPLRVGVYGSPTFISSSTCP